MENSKTPNKAIIAVVVIALLAVATTAVIILTNNQNATDSSSNVASDLPTTSPSEGTTGSPSSGTLKDGTYSATGSYQTPGGQESIGVKVTLAGGVITDAEVTKQGKTGEAQEYQSDFVAGFKSQVVGKKASEVSLSRVAGSSLTSRGFNDALDDIQKQAQS